MILIIHSDFNYSSATSLFVTV